MAVDYIEHLKTMRASGIPMTLPNTERLVLLRTVEPDVLLKEGSVPDILTPLVIKSIYEDLTSSYIQEFLANGGQEVKDALAMADAIDLIVGKAIADDTKIEDLVIAEKRWIFRLVMLPAELLISFCFESEPDVGDVPEGEDVREDAE